MICLSAPVPESRAYGGRYGQAASSGPTYANACGGGNGTTHDDLGRLPRSSTSGVPDDYRALLMFVPVGGADGFGRVSNWERVPSFGTPSPPGAQYENLTDHYP